MNRGPSGVVQRRSLGKSNQGNPGTISLDCQECQGAACCPPFEVRVHDATDSKVMYGTQDAQYERRFATVLPESLRLAVKGGKPLM